MPHGLPTSFFSFPAQTSGFLRPPAQQASLPKWLPGLHLSVFRETELTTARQAGSLVHHGTGSTVTKAFLGDRTQTWQCWDFNGAGLSMFGY